jgi:hypothetical protein
MIEPTLAVQTAIRAALLDDPAVSALVPADHIQASGSRPDETPCIIMSDGSTTLHGHDYRSQRAAWVYIDLHVWALSDDDGIGIAKAIAFAVTSALDKPLSFEGCECDHFRVTASRFPRDPNPSYGHGVLSVEALVRWVI